MNRKSKKIGLFLLIAVVSLIVGTLIHEGFHIFFTLITGGTFVSFVLIKKYWWYMFGVRTTYPENHWIWESHIFLMEEIVAYLLTIMAFIVSFMSLKNKLGDKKDVRQ